MATVIVARLERAADASECQHWPSVEITFWGRGMDHLAAMVTNNADVLPPL